MGEYRPIEHRIEEASRRWPFIILKKKTSDEAAGPCPWCGGNDRFRIWVNGNYECRAAPGHCGRSGWIDEENRKPLTQQEILEMRVSALEHKQAEMDRRLSALEQMHKRMYMVDYYHQNLENTDNGALQYWYEAGMWPETIERYKLGYCQRCPTDHDGRPSYTIPVISNGKLWNIRHRLIKAENGDKYRPDIAGLPNVLFNADDLRADSAEILIVEGEKKSIIVAQAGFVNVGVMGKTGFDASWVSKFAPFQRVNVCYDPDGLDKAAEVAKLFNGRGRVVALPDKIDDMIVQYGCTMRDIQAFIDYGRAV